jgi:hypothetical protein
MAPTSALSSSELLEFFQEHDFSKIPTIPAEIRTSPFPTGSLMTVVTRCWSIGRNSFNTGGKVNGSNWIASHARSARRQRG